MSGLYDEDGVDGPFEKAMNAALREDRAAMIERTAQLLAHRATHGAEHDPLNGKIHGYCIVCGVPWPCEFAGTPPTTQVKP